MLYKLKEKEIWKRLKGYDYPCAISSYRRVLIKDKLVKRHPKIYTSLKGYLYIYI